MNSPLAHAVQSASLDDVAGGPIGFDEMAAALAAAASREAFGLELLEREHARSPHAVTARTIAEIRRTAAVIAAVHHLLRALTPHEALVAGLAAHQRRLRARALALPDAAA